MEAVHALLRESKGLASLRLQNHLYGCFLVMEDLASHVLVWKDGTFVGNGFTLDFERDFGWIGVRYGFLMDRGLVLEGMENYRAVWRERFEAIAALEGGAAQAAVDAVEDELLATLRTMEDPFFIRVLDNGALPQPLMERALRLLLLLPPAPVPAALAPDSPSAPRMPESPPSSRLSHATAEKPLRQRILAHTIRHHEPRERHRFAVTRRAHGTRK